MQDNQQRFQSMLPIGAELQTGKYRVERYLSSGGFGNTYVVRNVMFNEVFAMKEFFMKGINERDGDTSINISVSNPANSEQFEQQREKFKKEAIRLRNLHNKHLVQVHDLFEENGTAYYVMDYVEGESLSSRLKRTGMPMPEREALRILSEVLEGLDEVHRNKIWHLDLKPGNIMLDKKGNTVLIDFGASKQLTSNGYATSTVSMCYTPGYAPPEQVDQNIERIGPWTDLYALGATLYNLVTRNIPPAISDLGEPNAFQYPPTVSGNTRKLIEWMMNPSRQSRPQSIGEVRTYLQKMPEAAFLKGDALSSQQQPLHRQFNNRAVHKKTPLNGNVPPYYVKKKNSSSSWLKGCLIGGIVAGFLIVATFVVIVVIVTSDESSGGAYDNNYDYYPVVEETVAEEFVDSIAVADYYYDDKDGDDWWDDAY